jgi:hypothetical protein
MAKKKASRAEGPNQSAFIREVFKTNPNAKLGDAKKAWTDAGHKGEIGNSLFYVVKRKIGMTKPTASGKRRGRPPGSTNKPKAAARGNASGYEAVEDRLDEVILMLWELGDQQLASEFRVARRKIAAKLA